MLGGAEILLVAWTSIVHVGSLLVWTGIGTGVENLEPLRKLAVRVFYSLIVSRVSSIFVYNSKAETLGI